MIKLRGKDVLPKAALAEIQEHDSYPREEEKKETSEKQANGSQQRPNSGDVDLAGNECLEDCFQPEIELRNVVGPLRAASEESKHDQAAPGLGSASGRREREESRVHLEF